jgi:hypothetical protein
VQIIHSPHLSLDQHTPIGPRQKLTNCVIFDKQPSPRCGGRTSLFYINGGSLKAAVEARSGAVGGRYATVAHLSTHHARPVSLRY